MKVEYIKGFDRGIRMGSKEEFFNKLQDYILILSKDNKVVFCNNKLLKRLGYTLEESKNLYINDIVEEQNFKDIEVCTLRLKNNSTKCTIYKFEENDKECFSYYIIKEKITKNRIIRYKNLSSEFESNNRLLKKLDDEIRSKKSIEEELKVFLDISADFMGMIDLEGNFLNLNDKCADVLGWSREELIEKTWRGIVCEEDYNYTEQLLRELVIRNDGKIVTEINRYKCKDGSVKWLQWNLKYLSDMKAIVGTVKDLTQKIEDEEQKEQYEKELQLEKLRNEFFMNMSHEFKTPINIILSAMQLINSHVNEKNIIYNNKANLDKYIKSVKQNSYRLLKLSNNLIDMSKIDTDLYKLELNNYNIVDVVEDITMSVAEYVKNKEINIIFDTEVEEVVLACDYDKIERIMLNLLSNSIKYTGKGGKIEVKIKSDSNWVTIYVKDNGLGIPKNLKNKVFNRFIKIDTSLARRCEGSGIGLALVKALVEMHNGDVEVESELGGGAEFSFRLPIRKVGKIGPATVVEDINNLKIEKCKIEFSDIYDI